MATTSQNKNKLIRNRLGRMRPTGIRSPKGTTGKYLGYVNGQLQTFQNEQAAQQAGATGIQPNYKYHTPESGMKPPNRPGQPKPGGFPARPGVTPMPDKIGGPWRPPTPGRPGFPGGQRPEIPGQRRPGLPARPGLLPPKIGGPYKPPTPGRPIPPDRIGLPNPDRMIGGPHKPALPPGLNPAPDRQPGVPIPPDRRRPIPPDRIGGPRPIPSPGDLYKRKTDKFYQGPSMAEQKKGAVWGVPKKQKFPNAQSKQQGINQNLRKSQHRTY